MNFDLNIDNYTREELIQMFELPVNFDKNILEIKEAKLRDSIINNREIDANTQTKTLNFLSKAKDTILNGIHKQVEKLNNTFQEVYNSNYKLQSTGLENPDEHMVQVRKDKPYIFSFPSDIHTGVINPLKKRTLKNNLNIDSRFRDNYFKYPSTNFNITLPLTLNDVVQMQLAAIELPTSYYVVSKQYGNNYFNITIDSSSTVIKIPDGNYNPYNIQSAINTQLINAGEPFSHVNFIINISNDGSFSGSGQTLVGFDSSQNIHNYNSLTLDFQADNSGRYDTGTPLPLKFGWLLGFRNGVYTNNKNYVSEGVVDLSGPRYIYLVIDDYNNSVNNSFFSAFNNSVLNKNILARVSVKSTPFTNVEQNNLNVITTPREYFGPVNLLNLNIQLLDEYGRILDLNNMDYSFCLTLTTIYDI
jgi:hypothetical protein